MIVRQGDSDFMLMVSAYGKSAAYTDLGIINAGTIRISRGTRGYSAVDSDRLIEHASMCNRCLR